jgi:hypothetical protein
MRSREFSSDTFIIPPKDDHTSVLGDLIAVVQSQSNEVCGYPMTDAEANLILTLYHGLDANMRDRLMARNIEDMLAMTIRCHSLSEHDRSWSMYSHG